MFLFATPQHALTKAAMGPFTLLLGGTPQANLDAAKQAWPKVSAFLRDVLQAAENEPGK